MAGRVNEYLRRQAETLLALSRTSFDVVSIKRLRGMAAGLNQEAEALERSEGRGEGDPSRKKREEKRDQS
jgi:hypothetical protein